MNNPLLNPRFSLRSLSAGGVFVLFLIFSPSGWTQSYPLVAATERASAQPTAYGQCVLGGTNQHRNIEFWEWPSPAQASADLQGPTANERAAKASLKTNSVYRISVSTFDERTQQRTQSYIFDRMNCQFLTDQISSSIVCSGLGFDGKAGRFTLTISDQTIAKWTTLDSASGFEKETLMAKSSRRQCDFGHLTFLAQAPIVPSKEKTNSLPTANQNTTPPTETTPPTTSNETRTPEKAIPQNDAPKEQQAVITARESSPSGHKSSGKKSGVDYILQPQKDDLNARKEKNQLDMSPLLKRYYEFIRSW